jgi:hypothetical protein
MSKKASLAQTSLHSALSHLETLVAGAVLVAAGFGLSGLSTVKYSSLESFTTVNTVFPVFIAGLLIATGFIIAFSQQRLGFAVVTTIQQYSAATVAAILYAIGQFLIGFGNNLVPTDMLFGTIVIIAGYTLVAVSIIITGNTGLAISKMTAPSK